MIFALRAGNRLQISAVNIAPMAQIITQQKVISRRDGMPSFSSTSRLSSCSACGN
jgi:hypothetical protein